MATIAASCGISSPDIAQHSPSPLRNTSAIPSAVIAPSLINRSDSACIAVCNATETGPSPCCSTDGVDGPCFRQLTMAK